MFKKIGVLLAAVVASVTVVTIGATEIASAWNSPTVKGVAECITNQDGGVTSWKIDWTVTNNETRGAIGANTKISDPAGYSPVSYNNSTSGQTFTRTEVLDVLTGSAEEKVTQKWWTAFGPPVGDVYTHPFGDTKLSEAVTVWKPRTCVPTPVSASVSFQDPDCENQNTAAVLGADDTASIDYTVTGSVEPGGYVTVSANVNPGFTLGEGTEEWSHEFSYAEDCRIIVTPVEPTIDVKVECGVSDTYTIPAVEGVIYYIDGVVVAAGTYPLGAGEEVTITAEAADGYKIPYSVIVDGDDEVWDYEGDYEYTWTFTGSEVQACPTIVTPFAPTLTVNTVCGVADTFSVFAAQGVVYSHNGNHPLAAGVSVTITATPAAGYTFTEGAVTSWTFTGSEVQACAVDEPPVLEVAVVTALPVTGSGSGGMLVWATVLTLAGVAMLFARRLRPATTKR